jgi:hypothetical protein
MLQAAAAVSLDDWFEYTIGPPILNLTAAPYGGARYSVETRMDGRIFAKFHLDAGIGDVVIQPLETIECPDWLSISSVSILMTACFRTRTPCLKAGSERFGLLATLRYSEFGHHAIHG